MNPVLASDARPSVRAAFKLARGLARVSRLWGQQGLGTLYKNLGRLPALASARAVVEFLPGAFFETGLFEPYWAPTIVGGRPYEPEVMAIMRRFSPLSPTFVDGGANFGFWSIVATAPDFEFARAVAIEANPSTFRQLESNCALNGRRFVCVHRALSDTPGETVTLVDAESHAIAHVVAGGSGPGVTTTTIDTLVDELGWRGFDRFVLKIDVEGHDVAAIRGASRLMSGERDHVWILEDFASRGLPVLAHVIEAGYAAYYVDALERCNPVGSVGQALDELTRDHRSGPARNFVAAKRKGAFHDVLDAWAKGGAPRVARERA